MLKETIACLDRLFALAVFTDGNDLLAEVGASLPFKGGFGQIFNKWDAHPIFTGEGLAGLEGVEGFLEIKSAVVFCHVSLLLALYISFLFD
jgi:hypothetical protein